MQKNRSQNPSPHPDENPNTLKVELAYIVVIIIGAAICIGTLSHDSLHVRGFGAVVMSFFTMYSYWGLAAIEEEQSKTTH